jgi:hypothetical protein
MNKSHQHNWKVIGSYQDADGSVIPIHWVCTDCDKHRRELKYFITRKSDGKATADVS